MVAVVQLSIAIGSTLGGLLFDGIGYGTAFGVSTALLLAAAVLAYMTARIERARTA